jgi:outer membrane protein OmpA-like peptidoglycan-associated protein
VLVVGHTDTTGPSATNVLLGLRRAGIIRRLLVEAGLDATLIEMASHGQADPLVPTADEVAEPRNRRVDITVR